MPTAASASNLPVMIIGSLCENNHDPSYTQVVITQSEDCEELSLQDMDGVFLRLPVSEYTSSRIPSVSSSEVSVELLNASALQKINVFLLKSIVWNMFAQLARISEGLNIVTRGSGGSSAFEH